MSDRAYKHYTLQRPTVTLQQQTPRVTREGLVAATRGQFAGGPHTSEIIDRIMFAQANIDLIDKRRSVSGRLNAADEMDYAEHRAKILPLMRQIGLYLAAQTTPPPEAA